MNLPTYLKQHYKLIAYWIAGTIAALVLLAVLAFYFAGLIVAPTSERSDQVVKFMHGFGDTLGTVSLASSTEEIASSMDASYKPYLSDELLAAWKADPTQALGKTPDGVMLAGIRIKSVRNVGILSYVVKAYVETRTPVTIAGVGSGLMHGEKPYTFGVTWRGAGWKITEISESHAAPIE